MWDNTHNKVFKRDSQRLAILVLSLAFVIMAEYLGLVDCVVHPLTWALRLSDYSYTSPPTAKSLVKLIQTNFTSLGATDGTI